MDVYVGNHGTYVMGIFSNLEATCICVVKVYKNKTQWDIVEDFTVNGIQLEECTNMCKWFLDIYKIKYVFGNEIGKSICNIEDSFTIDTNKQYEGYEVTNIGYEHLTMLTLGNIRKIRLDKELKEQWENEFKNCDIESLKSESKTYPRIFALANVLKSVQTKTTMLDVMANYE